MRLTLEERIQWLEDGLRPRGKSRDELGIILVDGTSASSTPKRIMVDLRILKPTSSEIVSPHEKRERIDSYGRWYLRPSHFSKKSSKPQ